MRAARVARETSALKQERSGRRSTMQRFRFPVAVALTSIGLVAVLFIGGALVVRSALASGPWSHAGFGPPWAGGNSAWMSGPFPAQLSGLRDLPADERFA